MPRIRFTILICCLLSLWFAQPAFAQDALPLTQQFNSSNQPITFNYPTDWAIQVDADSPTVLSVNVGPDKAAFNKNPLTDETAAFSPGEVRIDVFSYPKEVMRHILRLATDAPVSMTDVLKYFIVYAQSKTIQYGAISETTVDDDPAARISFSVPQKAEGFLLAADYGDMVAALLIYNAPEEAAKWENTALAIFASVNSIAGDEPTREPVIQPAAGQAVDLTQSYTSSDGKGGFQYPAGWRIDDKSGGNFIINASVATNIPALNIDLNNPAEQYMPGEVGIQIRVATADALASSVIGLQNPTDDPVVFLQAAVEHANPNVPYMLGEVVPTTVNGLPAARSDLDVGTRVQGFVMDVHLARGILAGITVFTAAGEQSRWDATLAAIIASLHYGDVAESTSESTTSAVPDLNATYTAQDGSVSYNYPAGWGASSSLFSGLGIITLASSSSLLYQQPSFKFTYAPGEFILQFAFSEENPNAQVPGLSSTTNPADILDAYLKALISSYGTPSNDTIIGAVTAREINGQPGAQVPINHSDLNEALFILFRYRPGVFCLISITGAQGETAKLADTTLAILATVSMKENATPEATESAG